MKANNTGMLRKGRMLCNSTTVDRKPHVLLVWLIVLKFLTFSVSYLHAWTVQRLYWIRITSGQRSLFIEKSCKTQNNMKHLVLVSPFIAQADEMKHRSTSAACRSLFEFCFSLMHPSKVRNPPPPPPVSPSLQSEHLNLTSPDCIALRALVLFGYPGGDPEKGSNPLQTAEMGFWERAHSGSVWRLSKPLTRLLYVHVWAFLCCRNHSLHICFRYRPVQPPSSMSSSF